MKKTIIALIGDDEDRTIAADIFKDHGFYMISIESKVREFAQHLFSADELAKKEEFILQTLYARGKKVHPYYWVNLIMVSIPNDKNIIVFDDIEEDEIPANIMKVYHISKTPLAKSKHNVIINDSSKEVFIDKIEKICNNLLK